MWRASIGGCFTSNSSVQYATLHLKLGIYKNRSVQYTSALQVSDSFASGASLRCLVALLVLSAPLPVAAQNTGVFAARISKGIGLIDKGRFNDAINVLEEVWEQDQSDPLVAENLGIAYLYADRDVKQAQVYMEIAIAKGGAASFLMQHSHEKVAALASEFSDYCPGRLSIYRDHLSFAAGVPEHSFTIPAGEFREIKANRVVGRGEGGYHIRTADKKIYNLRPRSWNEREMKLVLYLSDKYLRAR
jgi:hypothetical protein